MPAGDGVSLPTTLAQMGSVAKTQAKDQQAANPAAPFAEQLDKDDDLKVQRVKETEESEKQKLDSDSKNPDKRKRRRLKRNRKQLADGTEDPTGDLDDENAADNDGDGENLGALIDMRV